MKDPVDGPALVYCEGAFNTTNGKTAHGLVRFTERYEVISVIDSRYAGRDAGEILDGRGNGIPVSASVDEAFDNALKRGLKPGIFRYRPRSRWRPSRCLSPQRHHQSHRTWNEHRFGSA